MYGSVNYGAEEGWYASSIESDRSLFRSHILDSLNVANFVRFRLHVLCLRLHLGLDSIEGVTYDGVRASKEAASDASVDRFFFPIGSLLVVRHFVK